MLPYHWTVGYRERRLRRRVARLNDDELRERAADARKRWDALGEAQGYLYEAGVLVGGVHPGLARVYLASVDVMIALINRRLSDSGHEIQQERVFLMEEARSRGFRID